MSRLSKFVASAAPGAGVQFRKQPYGSNGVRDFLRDVVAIANASVDGTRLIVIGVDCDDAGRKSYHPVNDKDFSGKPRYCELVNEYIEPAVAINYEPVNVDGKQIGVFAVTDCRERPYMMRVDFSEELRRGDAYMRVNDTAIKMGRRQLQTLFEKQFQDSVSGSSIEVGFQGEITSDELMQEMEQIRHKYEDQDREFLFETHAEKIQLVAYNQGQEPVVDASLALVLPNDPDLYIADRLPKTRRHNGFVECEPDAASSYPSVSLRDNSIHITCKLRNIPVGEPVDVFGSPLRVCPGPGLSGRKFGIHYALHGKNLRSPAKGRLRLLFDRTPS